MPNDATANERNTLPSDGRSHRQGTMGLGTLCHPIDSENLFGASREIFIRHGNELYRLTITRNDKLILQK